MSRICAGVTLVLLLAPASHAQHVSFGADLVSRYVWRGFDFGESASIQPSLAYRYGGTEIGTWASYALVPDGAFANEHDLWLSHTLGLGEAAFTFGLAGYYFPNAGADFFDLSGDGDGAHYLEPSVAYRGDAALPILLYAAVFAYNDPDRSAYLEVGYPFAVAGTDLEVAAGLVPAASGLYGTNGPALTNLSLSASHGLAISEHVGLPISATYVLNPYAERSYLVFGLGVRLD